MTPETRTVLLVDDDERLLRALARGLTQYDYKILTAISVAEAGVHLSREEIDVVVSDHRMPGVTGLSFLAAVHENYPHVRRIMLSGTVGSYTGWDLSRRADGLLEKPCSAERLHREIQSVLQTKETSAS